MQHVRANTLSCGLGALACAAAILAFSSLSPAQDAQPASAGPSVDEIVEKTNRVAYYQGKDGKAKVAMTIRDEQGRERERRFTVLRRDEEPEGDASDKVCKDQKFYVYFERPADLNKTVFLVWKHLERDDDRWLYLPALDLVKRIAASDKRTSFMGSHFFYEDISGRSLLEDAHELVETTDNYYVLKNTPKDPASVEFSYYKMWVHKTTFIPVKTEYYDKQGNKNRVYEALGVETIQDFPTVTKARMSDLKSKGQTDIAYEQVVYNVGLPEDVFTERYLRNPPRQHLR